MCERKSNIGCTKHLAHDVRPGDMFVVDWSDIGRKTPVVVLIVGMVQANDSDHVTWLTSCNHRVKTGRCARSQVFVESIHSVIEGEKSDVVQES